MFASVGYPAWLLWWLWGTYLTCAYGILRAWWIPYLGAADRDRAKRYGIRFADTHSFLPVRNGMRPDSLHVGFHSLIFATLVILAYLTFEQQ
jgi:predicted outer membrane lipoprotein